MSSVLRSNGEVSCSRQPRDEHDLPLFRFGLRRLIGVFTLACLLIAALAAVEATTAAVLGLAILIVVFHVFGTALGTQLRSKANHSIVEHRRRDDAEYRAPSAIDEEVRSRSRLSATRSPWHERRTPLPWLRRLVIAATILGGLIGVVLLNGTVGHRTSLAGIIVGAISLAVVAGWFAFIGCSFIAVFRHGVRDAMAEERRH